MSNEAATCTCHNCPPQRMARGLTPFCRIDPLKKSSIGPVERSCPDDGYVYVNGKRAGRVVRWSRLATG